LHFFPFLKFPIKIKLQKAYHLLLYSPNPFNNNNLKGEKPLGKKENEIKGVVKIPSFSFLEFPIV